MWLRKYTAVIKTSLKETMAYRFDALTSSLFSFLKIWMAYLLWKAIFGDKDFIGNYTFPMMLTYYILIAYMGRLAKSEGIIWETSDEVRSGTYTKYITRPINHFTYCLSRSLGKGIFTVFTDTAAFALWIFLFRKEFYLPENPLSILYFAGFMVLGLFTIMQIHYLVALISFKTVEIAGPYFFVNNIMEFMSGSFIPLILLPPVLREIFSFTPFYYLLYYPASLFLEENYDQAGKALAVIVFWNLIFFILRKIQYKRMIRLYEGVGA